jgi:rod shape-determining protein MreC
MQSFLEFIARFREYITLLLLTVICLSLMTYGNVAKLGGFRAVVIGSIGTIQSAFAWLPNPVALKNENQALRELNLQLSNEVMKMRQSTIENDKLRSLLNYKKISTYPLLTAEVVGKTSTETRNYITLNKGERDGVKEGMNIITDAGLVGIVIGTNNSFSLVQIIINRDSRISAKIQRTREDGIVNWDGTEFLSMKNIPKSYDVLAGDIIITSDYSNKYLKDIVIGKITEVGNDGNSLFRKIIIQPAVNFSSLEQVFVVMQLPNAERLKLERELEQALAKKGTPK